MSVATRHLVDVTALMFEPGILAIVSASDCHFSIVVSRMGDRTDASLLETVREGNVNLVRILLSGAQEMNVNEKEFGGYGFAPLHYAADRGHEEILKLLLSYTYPGHDDRRIDLEIQDNLGSTALIIASRRGHTRIVKLLLLEGANVLHATTGGFSSLHMAAFCGHTEIVNFLLHGNTSRLYLEPWDPLPGWSSRQYLEPWDPSSGWFLPSTDRKKLMDLRSSEEKFTALHMAASGSHEQGVHISASLLEAYRSALTEHYQIVLEAYQSVLDATQLGLDATQFDQIPFAITEHYQIVSNPPLDYRIETNLWLDFLFGIRDVLQLDEKVEAEALRANLEAYGNHPSGYLIKTDIGPHNYEGLVNTYVDLISYSNARDSIGRTALHYAASDGNQEVVEFLIWDFMLNPEHCRKDTRVWRSGGDRYLKQESLSRSNSQLGSVCSANVADIDGYTPLHLAAKKGYHNVVRGLMKDASDDINPYLITKNEIKFSFNGVNSDHHRQSLLPNAAARQNGHSRDTAANSQLAIDVELEMLPRPQLHTVVWPEDREGITPLHYVVEKNHVEVVKRLLQHENIDVFRCSSDGQSPWTIAFSSHKPSQTNEDRLVIQRFLRAGTSKSQSKLALYQKKLFDRVAKLAVEVEKAAEKGEDSNNSASDVPNALFTGLEIEIIMAFAEEIRDIPVDMRNQLSDERMRMEKQDLYSRWKEVNEEVLEKWEADKTKKPWNITLLHVAARWGFDAGLKKLLSISSFQESINSREEINGRTALHFAVCQSNSRVLTILLGEKMLWATQEDVNGMTALEMAVGMGSGKEYFEWLLMERTDVTRYVNGLYRDRQVHVDAVNAVLVGAAIIAGVTYAGWLQPPLGYIPYDQESLGNAATPNTAENFAAVQQYTSVRVFWIFNNLAFFSAIATVIAGAAAALPGARLFINKQVTLVRIVLRAMTFPLLMSMICVLVAFTAAGLASLPPGSTYQGYMTIPSFFGWCLCIVPISYYRYYFYRLSQLTP